MRANKKLLYSFSKDKLNTTMLYSFLGSFQRSVEIRNTQK